MDTKHDADKQADFQEDLSTFNADLSGRTRRDAKLLNFDSGNTSCLECAMSRHCLPGGLRTADKLLFDRKVTRHQLVRKGKPLFRYSETSQSLFALQSGMLKAVRTTHNGGERVISFTLPGELAGLDYPFSNIHTSTSIAVKTSIVCEIPFRKLEDFHHEMPNLPRQMMQLITDWQLVKQLRSQPASERLAGFLLNMSSRFHQHGMSATDLDLNMSRHDIGNYLDLPFETVSNLLSHLQTEGMLKVKRHQVTLTDIDRIKALVTLPVFDH